jgi:hypothetical protein
LNSEVKQRTGKPYWKTVDIGHGSYTTTGLWFQTRAKGAPRTLLYKRRGGKDVGIPLGVPITPNKPGPWGPGSAGLRLAQHKGYKTNVRAVPGKNYIEKGFNNFRNGKPADVYYRDVLESIMQQFFSDSKRAPERSITNDPPVVSIKDYQGNVVARYTEKSGNVARVQKRFARAKPKQLDSALGDYADITLTDAKADIRKQAAIVRGKKLSKPKRKSKREVEADRISRERAKELQELKDKFGENNAQHHQALRDRTRERMQEGRVVDPLQERLDSLRDERKKRRNR